MLIGGTLPAWSNLMNVHCGWLFPAHTVDYVRSYANEKRKIQSQKRCSRLISYTFLSFVRWSLRRPGAVVLSLAPAHSLWSHIHQLSSCSITLYGYESALTMAALYLSACACVREVWKAHERNMWHHKRRARGGGRELQNSIFAPPAFLFILGLTF